MDAPLSAVDAKVGSHIFEECIRGLLKSKLVVLVTHQIQYSSQASEIIILKKGKIEARGSYEQLKSRDWNLDTDKGSSFDFDRAQEINGDSESKSESEQELDSQKMK